MFKASTDWRSLWLEYQALLGEYGRAQLRCSEALTQQAARIRALEAEVVQLKTQVMAETMAQASNQYCA